ncbi:MAG: nucleotide exchange factor GrpE [Clostridia bacterium]|nr:nucleotide exchange factor GrpE [Clostridia bacterium]
MILKSITSLFESKGKKEIENTVHRIEKLAYKLNGLKAPSEGENNEIGKILGTSYELLERLEKRLILENKREHRDYKMNSGYATAKVSLSGSARVNSEELSKSKVEAVLSENTAQISGVFFRLIDLRDKVLLMKSEFGDNKGEKVEMLYTELGNILKKEGLHEIELSGRFNKDRQRIIKIIKTGNEEKNNTIHGTVRPGYTYNNILIRPQEVIVYEYDKESPSEEDTNGNK